MDKIAQAWAWLTETRWRWISAIILLSVIAGMLLRP
jgi:hypothetical protein